LTEDSCTEDCVAGFDRARKFKEMRQLGWMVMEHEAQDGGSAVDEYKEPETDANARCATLRMR
jgi:hypothetical protein